MKPVKFSKRADCHWHLSEILKCQGEFGNEEGEESARKQIIEFLGDDEAKYYDYLEDFLDRTFEQKCPLRMAIFQYLCAKHQICYTKAPAYMDFMYRIRESYTDLINDEAEYYYLSDETKNKLSENENLRICFEMIKKIF